MSFIGIHVDLRGQRIGEFTVDNLVGRTGTEPRYSVRCNKCGCISIFLEQSRLAPMVQGKRTVASLQCGNTACELSRSKRESLSLADMRRAEREEERRAVEAQREADEKAAQQRERAAERAAHDLATHRQYLAYLTAQWAAGVDDSKICSRDRWFQLLPSTRDKIIAMIENEPGIRLEVK